jgi:hypothetical protein
LLEVQLERRSGKVADGRRGQADAEPDRVRSDRSGLFAGEDILFDHSMYTPIAVNDLGDAKVDADRDQGDCLILGQLLLALNSRLFILTIFSAATEGSFAT